MKNALIPVGVFTLALLATTTWSVTKTPLPELPVDEVALADSLLADSLWRDSVATQHAATPHGGEAVASLAEHVDAPPPAAAQSRGSSESVGEGVDATAVTNPTRAQIEEAYQTLARIFARMKPAEAAEVLQHMSNREVQGVVRNLGARQAASVLSNLPERRAAELARLLLIPSPGGDE